MLLVLVISIVIVCLECGAMLMGTSAFSSKALGTLLFSLVLPYKLEFTNGPMMDISIENLQ